VKTSSPDVMHPAYKRRQEPVLSRSEAF
jgi:hypothetical protein